MFSFLNPTPFVHLRLSRILLSSHFATKCNRLLARLLINVAAQFINQVLSSSTEKAPSFVLTWEILRQIALHESDRDFAVLFNLTITLPVESPVPVNLLAACFDTIRPIRSSWLDLVQHNGRVAPSPSPDNYIGHN